MSKQSLSTPSGLALLPDEKVLWAGRSVRLSRTGLAFGACALALVTMLAAPLIYSLTTGDRSIFSRMKFTINGELITAESSSAVLWEGLLISGILGATFVIIGVLWGVGSLKSDYALTSRRVVFRDNFILKRTSSLDLEHVSQIERSGAERVGSLNFFTATSSLSERVLKLYRIPNQTFVNIEKPQDVEVLALEAILAARKEKSS